MIRGQSWIADDTGDVDYVRVRALTSVILAFIGGLSAIWVLFIAREIPTDRVVIVVSALVLPLTGGKIADAFSAVAQSKTAARIQTGDAPGRRDTDPTLTPPPGALL